MRSARPIGSSQVVDVSSVSRQVIRPEIPAFRQIVLGRKGEIPHAAWRGGGRETSWTYLARNGDLEGLFRRSDRGWRSS